ncbi:MAG: M36 family metallopeptidase [Saprospiraceae bacterium]|nr:M36 family metallopeptidase [Saprospiraceae bacterium]
MTNLFYWNNLIHDVTYNHGFTEAAGNFQVNNYGRGGVGADDVRAEAQDGGGTCNANFGTPPDGSRPTMQMYICGSRDGDFDNGVIAHEYAHGISNRLTGGPANVGCLSNTEQMGEGWSDWLGLIMTIEPGDAGTDPRPIGTWLFGQAPSGPGIRPFPYSTSLAIDPSTYDAIKTRSIPHGVGSVWCAMLWDLTWKLIDQYGYDPDLHNGSGGNNMAMLLITEAMKLQPCSPGFVDGRNAILRADTILNGAANACMIWDCFARRGLGFSASQGSSGSRSDGVEAYDMPTVCAAMPPMMECFEYTGGMQTWVVPTGVTSITIEAWGAEGGSAPYNLSTCGNLDMGGNGGYATGTAAVTPGQTINIFVGGRGQNGPGIGGFNGGGAAPLDPGSDPNTLSTGGGASDVRIGGIALTDRVIVAAGGGGAEWSGFCEEAGAGGGLVGGLGLGDSRDPLDNGGAGTQSAGGFAGNDLCGYFLNTPGVLGVGGRATFYHSGAGGGGYFGGGGAGCDGHGGGGSSYIGGVTGGSTTQGVQAGNGRVCIIFWSKQI